MPCFLTTMQIQELEQQLCCFSHPPSRRSSTSCSFTAGGSTHRHLFPFCTGRRPNLVKMELTGTATGPYPGPAVGPASINSSGSRPAISRVPQHQQQQRQAVVQRLAAGGLPRLLQVADYRLSIAEEGEGGLSR